MAVTQIVQAPLYQTLPVGQEVIFGVSNDPAVINQTKVKFIVEVYITSGSTSLLMTADNLRGTFKVTPNASGVGMIDLSNIVENYVSADNLASTGTEYKDSETLTNRPHPLHLVDKFSQSQNIARYMAITFSVEALSATSNTIQPISGTAVNSELYLLWNGYLKDTDELVRETIGTSPINWFGFKPHPFYPSSGGGAAFLTNAPTVQYADADDYGTFAFFTSSSTQSSYSARVYLKYYSSGGVLIDQENITRYTTTGSFNWNQWNQTATQQIQYIGCFPANLRNWSSTFKTNYDAGDLYGGRIDVYLANTSGVQGGKTYSIHLNCPTTGAGSETAPGRGYERIRLCWLNQWGGWDYYTFTKKSTRKISTKTTTYQQLGGTWNQSIYSPHGYKGGKKAFRKNATESITINTDFVSEDDNVMFEELTNSPEVYILKGYETTSANTDTLNRYVTPTTLRTSSFTKKTVANDKLIQYTFEIEKSKILRTQSI